MASSNLNINNYLMYVKEYTYKYTCRASKLVNISAADLGITQIEGYTLVGVRGYYSGNANVDVLYVTPTMSGTVMRVRNTTSTERANITASFRGIWVRNDVLTIE